MKKQKKWSILIFGTLSLELLFMLRGNLKKKVLQYIMTINLQN